MFRQGDIVAVPFPFTYLSANKLRPALVLSTDKLNRTGDLILAMITSKGKDDGFGVEITPDMLSVPLPKQSFVRFNRIVTLEEALVQKKFGEANLTLVNKVVEQLHALLSNENPTL